MEELPDTSKKEIYTYEAPWLIFGLNWSVRQDRTNSFRLALGSCVYEYNNQIERVGKFDHPYPATKVMWNPDTSPSGRDLLATTGDYLRLWNVSDSGIVMDALLNNNKSSEYCAPLTSFDWNETDPSVLGTSSIDTTCTIWDLNLLVSNATSSMILTMQVRTQLIAHDTEVYDITFARGRDVFASVGRDGSVRMFDLRNLEHSTIIYESSDLNPLLRLTWNKQDPNYLATFMAESTKTIILDIRVPSLPVAELEGHQSSINSVVWAPHSSTHLCTAGDDCQALIWDLSNLPRPVEDPILAYTAEAEINNLQWSSAHPDWVAIAFENRMQVLRV